MDFQGFQHSIPLLVFLVFTIAFAILSLLSYKKLATLPFYSKAGLAVLRFSALMLLLVLVLNPYFFSKNEVKTNPKILVLADNSESMGITKGDYRGSEDIRLVLNQLQNRYTEEIDKEYFTIGAESRQISYLDSLLFNETETNLTNAISQIQELEDQFDAAIIVSDGIITYGKNPVIQASNLTLPVYTIATGDTSLVRDITIRNIITNNSGYTDTRHQVDAEIYHKGFNTFEFPVQLYNSNGEILETQNIVFKAEEEVVTASFNIELEEPGIQQFRIQIPPQDDEWSIENNTSDFSIDVTDSKIRILDVAFEIHPDVKTVRTILQSDQNIELEVLTWMGGNRFIENEIPALNEMDLIIVHGLPNNTFNPSLLSNLDQKPVLYFHLPGSSAIRNNSFSSIELLENQSYQIFNINLIPKVKKTDHPVMELPEISFENLPPLRSSLELSNPAINTTTLFTSSYQGIDSKNPVILVNESGTRRIGNVTAWNWYKMYQSNDESERNFVNTLISNLAAWVPNDPDDRLLKISPSKTVFNVTEPIKLNADLKNESGELENEGLIEITVQNPDGNNNSYTMKNTGNGVYGLEIPTLSPGHYNFSATARKGDRVIDTQSGEFLIEDSNAELINTVRDDDLLLNISTQTGGKFFTYDDLSLFWETLENDNLLTKKTEIVESYTFPVRSFYWFLIVLVLLGTEWMIRKYYSLP